MSYKDPAKQSEYYRKWYAKNGRKRDEAKVFAHSCVMLAVKRGTLIRPDKCSICPRTEKIEGHHEDYDKPLEVVWYCNRCHRKLHKGLEKLST